MQSRRVGIFGWGIVAPQAPNIDAFERKLALRGSWLTPFDGFGPSNFLVGMPEFQLADYKSWIDARFPPTRFPQLEKKMGTAVQYAVGAFIQSLQQNPGIEEELRSLKTQAHVYLGTGLGDLPVLHNISLDYHRSWRKWIRHWADPKNNAALRSFLSGTDSQSVLGVPPLPETVALYDRDQAEEAWWNFWTHRSVELQEYLKELQVIEGLSVEGEVETAKLAVIKEKRKLNARLQKKWNAPEPPWNEVSANLLWNIPNTPSAQVSMLGHITGMTFAPVAACSSFGYALKLAMNSITLGDAKAVVVGMSDPPPHPLTVGAFYQARVLSADGHVSKPLTGLRGTHIAGGAAVWIVGDYKYMTEKGFKPLGMEPIAVGVSADANHIITPSKEGSQTAIMDALNLAGISAESVSGWDLHATATPGDFREVQNAREILRPETLFTARKGTFGHGMSVSGGWELTAQYLGVKNGTTYPTELQRSELNPKIREYHDNFVFDQSCPATTGVVGKMSMGIGGINVCILSRPWNA